MLLKQFSLGTCESKLNNERCKAKATFGQKRKETHISADAILHVVLLCYADSPAKDRGRRRLGCLPSADAANTALFTSSLRINVHDDLFHIVLVLSER